MIILLAYFQIAVGITNVVGALIRFFIPYERNTRYKYHIGIYLMLVAVYFLIYAILAEFNYRTFSDEFFMVYLFVLPWFLAGYYWFTIYSPKTKTHVEES